MYRRGDPTNGNGNDPGDVFEHYDSAGGMNARAANALAAAVAPHLVGTQRSGSGSTQPG